MLWKDDSMGTVAAIDGNSIMKQQKLELALTFLGQLYIEMQK